MLKKSVVIRVWCKWAFVGNPAQQSIYSNVFPQRQGWERRQIRDFRNDSTSTAQSICYEWETTPQKPDASLI